MALLDRLAGFGDPDTNRKLPVNTFWATLYELSQGQVTRQQMIDYFQLDAGEIVELDWVIGRYNAQPNATAKAKFVDLVQVVFYLAESEVPGYVTNAQITARLSVLL